MPREVFIHRSQISAPAQAVFDWHARDGAFERLTPPWQPVRLVSRTGGIDGGTVVIDIKAGPVWRRWVAEHRGYEAGHRFQDVQVSGPFALWEHTHTITPNGPESCELEDRIEYALPGGSIGRLIAGRSLRLMLERMFEHRHRVTADDIARHRAYKEKSAMKVLVSGASGLVGSALVPFLSTGGHEVHRLVRTPTSEPRTIQWDPQLGNINRDRLAGFDAVVHLSGENIASRWTRKQMYRIRESRVESTRLLSEALARSSAPPKSFLCASATGFYGDRGSEPLDETSASGTGFLSDVCREWENASESLRAKGIRTAFLRFGIILTPAGGALAKMLLPFKLGLGGPIGDGKQYWSWIGIDDVIGAIHHVLM
ncbi:MAG: TIGR01777 family oxidoreductase, partial [Planctomycetaceae bacterium]